jgi:hypothetical protein
VHAGQRKQGESVLMLVFTSIPQHTAQEKGERGRERETYLFFAYL